ncbi:MAG: nucleotide-binding domain containing protein, partial [Candidatus Rokuibacteriota bacterium]
ARGGPATLLLTGGETAASVCRALGATGLALRGELEPGLAVAALADGPFAGLVVVTKAGGFGDAETLARIHERCT